MHTTRSNGAPEADEEGTPDRSRVRQIDSVSLDRPVLVCESEPRDRLMPETARAIAHHIRNPMAGIRGAVEVIGFELAHSNPDLAGVVEQITRRIDDLDRSLDAMLNYLRPAALRLGSVELAALIERIAAEEARPVGLGALDIRLECDDVVLAADAAQLTHTIVNLLTNSAEALPSRRGRVELTLSKDHRCAIIALRDGAGGIPADVLPRVCEPFFTTKPRALGLGLTNAREVVRAHGGELEVRMVDGGTEVRLRLPLSPPESA